MAAWPPYTKKEQLGAAPRGARQAAGQPRRHPRHDQGPCPRPLFVVDTRREEHLAIREARNRLHIPVVALIDTNSDPDVVDYGIPANDDAIRSVNLMTSIMADAIMAGKGTTEITAEEMAAAPAEAAAEQPAEEKRAMTLEEVLAQPQA